MSDADVQHMLQTVRTFYKGGGKSTNKRYDINKITNLTPKHYRRNDIDGRDEQILNTRRSHSGKTIFQSGTELFASNNKSGNCQEMCCVTAYLIKTMMLGLTMSSKILVAYLRGAGDHAFIVISESGSLPTWSSIPSMDVSDDNFWTIDCWANVAGPARSYHLKLVAKLTQWSADHKQIRTGANVSSSRYNDPVSYLPQLLTSQLGFLDAITMTI